MDATTSEIPTMQWITTPPVIAARAAPRKRNLATAGAVASAAQIGTSGRG
jgi:hypothetical protein